MKWFRGMDYGSRTLIVFLVLGIGGQMMLALIALILMVLYPGTKPR